VSRYRFPLESVAALAANTGFLWINSAAGGGSKIRRVTIGLQVSTGATITNQQIVVGINRTTSAGTTPTAVTPDQLDPNSVPPLSTWASAFVTPPSTSATDAVLIALNSQTTVDVPWEGIEEFIITKGTANGVAFINRDNALPANTKLVITVENEE
jgi:hypothetical protein